MKKNKNYLLLVILFIIIAGVLLILLFKSRLNYKKPIKNMFEGFNRKDINYIEKSYHPCVMNYELNKAKLEADLKPLESFSKARYDYKIVSKRLLNNDEIKEYNERYKRLEKCNKPLTIKKAYEVTIEVEENLNEDKKTVNKTKMDIGLFGYDWYILE